MLGLVLIMNMLRDILGAVCGQSQQIVDPEKFFNFLHTLRLGSASLLVAHSFSSTY